MPSFSARLSSALVLALATSCTSAQGSFEDLAWSPVATSFALADRHDLVVSRGTVVATRKPDSAQRLTLFFSGASVAPDDDWRHYSFSRLLNLRRDLSMHDALLVDGVPLDAVAPGAEFALEWEGSGLSDDGPFEAALAFRPTLETGSALSPIGERASVVLTIEDADKKAGGFVRGSLDVTLARTEEQEGDVATGTVTIAFQVPVVAERRGKSNLAIARPILRCAAARGPTQSAGCRDAEPEPLLDASGLSSSEAVR